MEGFVYEQFLRGDWAKGPAGTGVTGFVSGPASFDILTGYLAESFKTPEIGVWVLDIRKGVRFALDPNSEASKTANGREMTADDAKWSIDYLNTNPASWINLSQPALAKNTTVEKTGPWQITIRTPVDPGTGYCWILGGGGSQYVFAKEVVEKYGKNNDWRQAVGTGPYMLQDFVQGNVATFIRNPNYWGKNTVGPGKGDQLPYPDGVKYFIVPDLSTRLAAMRTGRADWVELIQEEDAQGLFKTNSQLQSARYLGEVMRVALRTDKQELPYKDVKVRQALMLAIDYESIKKDFYSGRAEILTMPVAAVPGTEHMYVSTDKLLPAAGNLFKYNPDKAKQLLAEAGYPNGLKAKMIVQNISQHMDSASAIKAMWAKVGVDVELQPREGAIYRSINSARSHDDMVFRTASDMTSLSLRYVFSGYRGPSVNNPSYIDDPYGKDPVIEKAYQDIQKTIFVDWKKADSLIRDLIPHVVEQAYYIPFPTPYVYRIWQPWVKNTYGESNAEGMILHNWIDQDLKEKMIGRR